MDPNQLTQEIKDRFDHATQKKLLKEKYHSKLTFAAQGGMWRAGPELLVLLKSQPEEEIVIGDEPMMVKGVQDAEPIQETVVVEIPAKVLLEFH